MNEAFENLPQEKQTKIINAALAEFVRYGYKKATTDNIVKEAGIGKGMLFYYFKNKLELYKFLIDYSAAFYDDYLRCLEAAQNNDLIEFFRTAVKYKTESYLKHPAIWDFFARLFTNRDDVAVSDEVKAKIVMLVEKRAQVLHSVDASADASMFRDDLLPEKIIKYIRWNMDGYSNYSLSQIKALQPDGIDLSKIDYKPYIQEFDEYLNDMKLLFYK